MSRGRARLGAHYLGRGRCEFLVWAPLKKRAELLLQSPRRRFVRLRRRRDGYHQAMVRGVKPGQTYWYRLDGGSAFPDPASQWQPRGVHQASAVTDPSYPWDDEGWRGLPLCDYLIYELHVGTFTSEGTFEAVIPHLKRLRELGVTALELMPVAQFSGSRNWGYDGVYPFAVQNSYGGPSGLKRLVNACHREGLAVVLDVVYNHLGPEGNYLGQFAPYFTDRYRNPWGEALNFDGAHSRGVRRYFLENALFWQTEFHVDALRLDAVHAIGDSSAVPFWAELAAATQRQAKRLERPLHLIAESDLNDVRVIQPRALGGYGLDAQWSDDFHHALHVLLTGERTGYYADFGGIKSLAEAYREGFVFTGQYSRYRNQRHGTSARLTGMKQFVVCAQNHDQIGNRTRGERLGHLVSFEAQKLAAAAVLLSPFVPFLFMGEEYGEPAPFFYFISHSDPDLVEAVRRGRCEQLASFRWRGQPPDPQAERTFQRCQLRHALARRGKHRLLHDFYREIIAVRKRLPAFARIERKSILNRGHEANQWLEVHYDSLDNEVCLILCFARRPVTARLRVKPGEWRTELDSGSKRWGGKISRVPERLTSKGALNLNLSPESSILLSRVH